MTIFKLFYFGECFNVQNIPTYGLAVEYHQNPTLITCSNLRPIPHAPLLVQIDLSQAQVDVVANYCVCVLKTMHTVRGVFLSMTKTS